MFRGPIVEAKEPCFAACGQRALLCCCLGPKSPALLLSEGLRAWPKSPVWCLLLCLVVGRAVLLTWLALL